MLESSACATRASTFESGTRWPRGFFNMQIPEVTFQEQIFIHVAQHVYGNDYGLHHDLSHYVLRLQKNIQQFAHSN